MDRIKLSPQRREKGIINVKNPNKHADNYISQEHDRKHIYNA